MQLNVVDYNFINDEEKRVHRGLIAQELREVIPTAVRIEERDGISDFHSVSSKELIGYMLGTIQHMDVQYKQLLDKYNELEKKMI
jgi:hypothetical protein